MIINFTKQSLLLLLCGNIMFHTIWKFAQSADCANWLISLSLTFLLSFLYSKTTARCLWLRINTRNLTNYLQVLLLFKSYIPTVFRPKTSQIYLVVMELYEHVLEVLCIIMLVENIGGGGGGL